MATATWTDRFSEAAETYDLAVRAAGSWERLARKLAAALRSTKRHEVEQRLLRLMQRGIVRRIPTRLQRMIGAVDMMRFFLGPSSLDDYSHRSRTLAFSVFLRFLDNPAALADPIGLRSARDTIVAHLMHVVHAYPLYDLQLLEMFEDGLATLEHELELFLAGTHPRGAAIEAVAEDPDYHAWLRAHLDVYRAQRVEAVNDDARVDPRYRDAGHTFGSLSETMRYCSELPRTLRGALWHLARVRTWDDARRAAPGAALPAQPDDG